MLKVKRLITSALVAFGFSAALLVPGMAGAQSSTSANNSNINANLCAGANLDF